MTILAADDFNRADAIDMGGLWANLNGQNNLQIVGNAVIPNAGTGAEGYTDVTWPDDQYSQAVCATAGVTNATGPGLCLRGSFISQDFYRLNVCHAASNNITVNKVVAGVSVQIAQVTEAWTDGATWRGEIQGTTLRVYHNGVQVGTDLTDAAIASGTPGLSYRATAASSAMDDWEGGVPDPISPPVDADYTHFPKFRLRRT